MLDNIELELKLKIMYIITIVLAGGFGIMMLISPSFVMGLLSQPAVDLYIYGVPAAIWTAFGLLAILGLRDPIKYMPILLFQFIYKLIWTVQRFIRKENRLGIFTKIFLPSFFSYYNLRDVGRSSLILPFKSGSLVSFIQSSNFCLNLDRIFSKLGLLTRLLASLGSFSKS